MGSDGRRIGRDNKGWLDTTKIHEAAEDWKCNSRPGLSHRIQMPAGHAKRVYSALLFTGNVIKLNKACQRNPAINQPYIVMI